MAYKQKSLGGPLSKMFKRDPKKLVERNQRRHKRNLRVDWDPNKIDKFNQLYKAGDFEEIQKDPSYSKGSGQGGTDVGNHLRMMKKKMMLPNGQTNTQPPKENEKVEIKRYDDLDTSFAKNPYLSNKKQAETGMSINQFERNKWNDRWLAQYPEQKN